MEKVSFLKTGEADDETTIIIDDTAHDDLDNSDDQNAALNKVVTTNNSSPLYGDSIVLEVQENDNAAEWIFDEAGHTYIRNIEDVQCESILVEEVLPKKRSRHKFPQPNEWEQNRRKRLRQEGKSYVTKRGILMPEKTFSVKQCTHCSSKCHEFFNDDELKEMFDNFWKMDWQNKRQYLSQLVDETNVKRVRTKSAHSRRSVTRHYYLIKNSSQRKKVCRSFFMDVFKVSPNFIKTICRKRLKSGIVERDLRGSATPSNKRPTIVRDFIRNHINQFRRPRSNGKASEREYLPSSLTLKSMYSSYVSECEKIGIQPEKYWLYGDVFHKNFNLHFRKPAKCKESAAVKGSSSGPSQEWNRESPLIEVNEEIVTVLEETVEPAIITIGPAADNRLQILHSTEEVQNLSIDYKTLYEKEVKKNETLQREIQKLTLMLEKSNGTCNYFQ